ncbi:DNA-binding transcriptional regulator YbjK [Actinokineospora alba]|uniref:DNA-binding transcriptional regulator YbjK n=1 Tax=Actinokineospora alba TaxID=504798 RepID=A0A1H0TXE3_9PSEU|nr:TetR family transcriptional regulator C-terminal domain-containing protein [Actinokineospora alba]TDP70775.1 TetR family transcriptional regulator [Actinokineospora alba]SDJ16135.1 DNA-binding transcriptional regulator YbjK [Actinokineospora alba]SDP58639.1 DNA-binding transcriptional regulator YbjK [Actinokineospora alba]
MPKQVDHQARRQQIAEAVCRLAGSQGLDAVSLRQVAVEAGVSMGMVQHYFTTKDDMLLFAFHTVSERVEQRIRTAVADVGSDARTLLRALLVDMLPVGAESRAEAPVWAAFLARAIVEPRLAKPLREGGRGMSTFIADHIRAGAPRENIDPTFEALTLLALVDGLMSHLLIGQIDDTTALATLDHNLDRIFGHAHEQRGDVVMPTGVEGVPDE